MTYQRRAYDDASTTDRMVADCRVVEGVLARIGRPTPSLAYEDHPREVRKPTIEVSDAASRLAAALHLQLD
jgi:hypothetical protein